MADRRVFLSYAPRDRGIVEAIARQLDQSLGESSSGEKLFADLHPGEDFAARTDAALRSADSVVVLLSADAIVSPSVGYEIGLAHGHGKRIIPVVIGELDPNAIPPALRRRQMVDARDARTPEEVATRVAEALHEGA